MKYQDWMDILLRAEDDFMQAEEGMDDFMADAARTVELEGWPIPEEVEEWLAGKKETSDQKNTTTATEPTTFNRGAVVHVVSPSGENLATLTVQEPVMYVQVDALRKG